MRYPGGKGCCFHQIINRIPPHNRFVESHLGGGSVIRHILPAPGGSFGIEADAKVIERHWQSPPSHISVIHGLADYEIAKLSLQKNDFLYCDPPYVMSSRKAGPCYRYEMDNRAHKGLLTLLKLLPCMIMISGYYSDLYMEELEDWRVSHFQAQTRGGPAIEYVWMNYSEPTELHDYRYLGEDFRERERIQRKIARHVNRLQQLPVLERMAIIQAIKGIS